MTIEPTSGEDGLDDLANEDWLVRTLAVRDLVRCGDSEGITRALGRRSTEVRYLAAAALGILEAESSLDRLHRLLREAPESTVRSQAAISIGQIGEEASIALLELQAQTVEQRDIPPQCRIAIDHIRRYDGDQSELRKEFEELDVAVATVECHDVYRSRVMAGREPKPNLTCAPITLESLKSGVIAGRPVF